MVKIIYTIIFFIVFGMVQTTYSQTQKITYTYDSQNRIKTVLFPNGNSEIYYYDKVGNRENMLTFSTVPTNINEHELTGDFKVYPNPTDGFFNISGTTNNIQDFVITIIDNTGKEIKIYSINSTNNFNQMVDITTIATGIYYVTLKSNYGSKIWKIVKM